MARRAAPGEPDARGVACQVIREADVVAGSRCPTHRAALASTDLVNGAMRTPRFIGFVACTADERSA